MAAFTIRILGVATVRRNVERARRNSALGTSRALSLVAADLLERSNALAPILTGALIRSGRVTGSGFVRGVSYGTNHGVFAHEQITPAGPRNLGPISSTKPATADGPVGGHFVTRPFDRNAQAYIKFINQFVGVAGGFQGGAAPRRPGKN